MHQWRWTRWATWLAFVPVAALAACSSPSASNQLLATYHGNNARTGYWADTSITPQNAGSLKQKWAIPGTSTISAQAVVANGFVYWGDWNGFEHRVASTSGKANWSTFVGRAPKPPACPFPLGDLGVTSTATVGVDSGRTMLWVGGGGGTLYALDATTGAIIWRTKLGAPPENVLWSSPALYKGSIYEGVASWNDCPGVVYGKVFRIDAATGAIQAVFSPEKGRCAGGGIWTSPTVDARHNALFVTSGNDDCNSPVQNSIFRLDPTTMAVQSQWQAPGNPLVIDADFGATPDACSRPRSVEGPRQLVGGESKNGVYYAFDRQEPCRRSSLDTMWSRTMPPWPARLVRTRTPFRLRPGPVRRPSWSRVWPPAGPHASGRWPARPGNRHARMASTSPGHGPRSSDRGAGSGGSGSGYGSRCPVELYGIDAVLLHGTPVRA